MTPRATRPDHIAGAGKMVPAATGTLWPATTADSERRWARLAVALIIIAGAAILAISFGVMEP